MKLYCLLPLCLLSTIGVHAVIVDLQMTNVCSHVDGERNQHVILPDKWQSEAQRVLSVSITGVANTNTAFLAAFGLDGCPTNSLLESSEHAVSFGWNAGSWEIRPRGLRTRFTTPPVSTNAGEKTLCVNMRISSQGEVSEIAVFDGGPEGTELFFSGLDLANSIPEYLNPLGWNLLRWTTRGFDDDAQATAVFSGVGSTLLIR